MDMRTLRYLITIAEEHSISGAATRLHMTQPPLSIAMKQLERELGVKLLTRHPRGITTTPAGAYLVDQAKRVTRDLDTLTERVRSIGDGRSGALSIAVTAAHTWRHVPNLLSEFVSNAPDVDIDLMQSSPSEVITDVMDHRVQAGMVYCADILSLQTIYKSALNVHLIASEPTRIAVPPDSHFQSETLDLRDLSQAKWILPWAEEGYPGLASIVREVWQRVGVCAPVQHVTSLEEALALVQAGFGVAPVPDSARDIAAGRAKIITPKQSVDPLHAVLLWRTGRNPEPTLERFLQTATSRSY
jgi:DNA-binding transcriptional LysR family regulator